MSNLKVKPKEKDFMPLDSSEKEIMIGIEKGEYKPIKNHDVTIEFLREATNNYEVLQQSKRITIRINNSDLIGLKTRASKKNIPYQTLINSIVHQYLLRDSS